MPEPLFDAAFLKKLEMITLVSKQLFRSDSRGERRSASHGASVEFADFRPYVQGDDFRRIDWNAFAKFENLILRLFVEEQELSVHILLDCSGSMDFGTPNKFDYARRLAAALAYMALANTDRVTLTPVAVDDEAERLLGPASNPLRGKPGIVRITDMLAGLKPAGRTDLNASLQRFALQTRRAGLVILISDLLSDSGYQEGLKRLRFGKHELVTVHVLSPQELQPDLDGDLRLVDAETRQAVEISANKSALAAYAKRLGVFLHGAQSFAHKHGAGYVLASTQTPFEDLVLRQLRALGLAK